MIRVFVGADGNNCDLESQSVLEYSIRRHASERVAITWMQYAASGPWSGWQTASARTPFSHFRWSIPAVCDYQGRAIYCDSDFIFRADVAELWHQDIPGVLLLRNQEGKLRTCCMLIDCARAKQHIPALSTLRASRDVQGLMLGYFRQHRHLLSAFAGDWNCIDLKGYDSIDDPRIKAIHYSRMECQVHLKHAIPRLAREGRRHWYDGEVSAHWRPELQALFDQLLLEAFAAGFTLDRYRVPHGGVIAKRSFAGQKARVMTA